MNGTLPADWKLPSLQHLNLSYLSFSADRGLDGSLPNWAGLPSMQQLKLQYNRLEGALNRHWILTMPQLTHLDLSGNKLGGWNLPEWAGGDIAPHREVFQHLQHLNLAGNNIPGALPGIWPQAMPRLKHLDLSRNAMQSNWPSGEPCHGEQQG